VGRLARAWCTLILCVDLVLCERTLIQIVSAGVDGFGGLVVSMLSSGTRVRWFKPGMLPQHPVNIMELFCECF
jgi:hypothetical protein